MDPRIIDKFTLSEVSLRNLKGVHPDLVRVVKRAIRITQNDFRVIEGRRSLARQRELVNAGASRTMKSRHLTGHAVDLLAMVGGKARWDWPLYHGIANAMKVAAAWEKVPLTWGGDWRTFKDGPHFELPPAYYPK